MAANGTQTTQNYLVPASGTTHGYVYNSVLSATPQGINFDGLQIDSNPFCPSGVFIDNTQGTGPITININQMGYNIVCPAGTLMATQYPAPNPQAVSITGLGQATLIFVDFPVIPFQVSANGASSVTLTNAPVALAPQNSTPVAASSGNVANAAAVATMPAVAGKTNYVTGIEITGGGATAASLSVATLAGLSGGTLSYVVAAVIGATLGNLPICIEFDPPLPANDANTAVTLTVPALGAGNTNSVANIHGYVV